MESRIGLDYIVENPEYTAKLATGNYTVLVTPLYSPNNVSRFHFAESKFKTLNTYSYALPVYKIT